MSLVTRCLEAEHITVIVCGNHLPSGGCVSGAPHTVLVLLKFKALLPSAGVCPSCHANLACSGNFPVGITLQSVWQTPSPLLFCSYHPHLDQERSNKFKVKL